VRHCQDYTCLATASLRLDLAGHGSETLRLKDRIGRSHLSGVRDTQSLSPLPPQLAGRALLRVQTMIYIGGINKM
jgi:hypothetical protein